MHRPHLERRLLVGVVDDPRASGLERGPQRDQLGLVQVVDVRAQPPCGAPGRAQTAREAMQARLGARAQVVEVDADPLAASSGRDHVHVVAGGRGGPGLLDEDPDVERRVQGRQVRESQGGGSSGPYPGCRCAASPASRAARRPIPGCSSAWPAMAHRGPDGEGVWADDVAGLAFRRLAIIDLDERSNQPLHLGAAGTSSSTARSTTTASCARSCAGSATRS